MWIYGFVGLTRHKISDREPTVVPLAGKRWMANTQKVGRTLARGSLHRLVRCRVASGWPEHLASAAKATRKYPAGHRYPE